MLPGLIQIKNFRGLSVLSATYIGHCSDVPWYYSGKRKSDSWHHDVSACCYCHLKFRFHNSRRRCMGGCDGVAFILMLLLRVDRCILILSAYHHAAKAERLPLPLRSGSLLKRTSRQHVPLMLPQPPPLAAIFICGSTFNAHSLLEG